MLCYLGIQLVGPMMSASVYRAKQRQLGLLVYTKYMLAIDSTVTKPVDHEQMGILLSCETKKDADTPCLFARFCLTQASVPAF